VNKIPKTAVAVLGLVLLVSACSSTSSAEEGEAVPAQSPSGSTTTLAPTVSVSSTTMPAETETEALPVNPDIGVEVMSLLSAESGNGTRPILAWDPVPGSFMYSLVVLTPDGEPYWAWEGVETSVHVGGEPQLKDLAAGPSVVPGMTWSVAAYDDEFHVIAVSRKSPISP